MKTFRHILAACAIAAAFPMLGYAQSTAAPTSVAPETSGVVKKVNLDQGKVTISHGPLVNLDMPAMTMVFRVADPQMLETVKAGDNIKFIAEKANGAFTVVHIKQAS